VPYCDAHGMVYDSQRDRMILGGVGGGYQKEGDGTLLAFDFKTRSLDVLSPENADLAKTHNARELAYAAHADWVLFGELYRRGDDPGARLYTRVYDCARNKMFLLDAGDPSGGRGPQWLGYSSGWMYDPVRKLVYVFTILGEAYALRLDPAAAQLLERP
jgi:hypothetical protein